MIKAFCTNAASFQIPNQDGATALIRAAKSGHCSIVKLLLEKGADVDKVNKVRNDKFMLWSIPNAYMISDISINGKLCMIAKFDTKIANITSLWDLNISRNSQPYASLVQQHYSSLLLMVMAQ